MSTLVVSDLHLGHRLGRDVTRRPEVRERMLAAVDDLGAERVVLLGDTIELVHRHPRRSMVMAEPVLRWLGRALGPEREVIIVPGNHDGPMVRRWALAQGDALEVCHPVPATASPALESVVSWLAPARVRVSYPGVWLGDGIWATHGHYLDHHLLPDAVFGLLRPPFLDRGAITAIGYERLHRHGVRSRESLLDRLVARPVGTLMQLALEPIRVLPRMLLNAGMAQVTASLLDLQMRRAAVPAMARVAQRMGIEADWVLFGHVHRRGPIGSERWPSPLGNGPRLLNTGAWLFEPLLVDRATTPHPYWPGGAVVLEEGRAPYGVGLLDDMTAGQLHPQGATGAG